jgi:pyruvate,orthophosphate dikinase
MDLNGPAHLGSAIYLLDGKTQQVQRSDLGGKAWSVQRMQHLGIPTPPAFVIGTTVCRRFYSSGQAFPSDISSQLPRAMSHIERLTNRTFGDATRPLLVSVRSGAEISMPGMMETVLNLGMTCPVETALARESGNPEYAAQTRQRFETQFREVVGEEPPEDPWQQLSAAIEAVLRSWESKRAIAYRAARSIPNTLGTAVTVQAMVFGNADEKSGTGVLFSRDPLYGKDHVFGEWLPRGQGEDIVSGRMDAEPLSQLSETMPDVYAQLIGSAELLERDARDVQDIEFTVESGTLWILQARAAKRSPEAAVRLAVLLVRDGLITPTNALDRVTAAQVATLVRPHIEPQARSGAQLLAAGVPACPGVVSGVVVTDPSDAETRAFDGESVIFARPSTDPDDVPTMSVVSGVITEIGGATSHAAVVCREIGTPCVVGCGSDLVATLAGQQITVDANTGHIFAQELPITRSTGTEDDDLRQLHQWAVEELDGDGAQNSLAELLQARAARRDVTC